MSSRDHVELELHTRAAHKPPHRSRVSARWGTFLTKIIKSTNSTFVNRGGAVLVDAPPYFLPPLAAPQYGDVSNRISAAAMNNYMGWETNIDSAFTPVSAADVEAWQAVLRRRATVPHNLASHVARVRQDWAGELDLDEPINASHSGGLGDDLKVYPNTGVTPTIYPIHVQRAIDMPAEKPVEAKTLIAANGGAHGFSACLRSKLSAGCDGLPHKLCVQNTTEAYKTKTSPSYGVSADGNPPTGTNASCSGNLPYFELWATSTFCLMPGGDGFDRGATVQALDVACIPVFFSGTGKGDLLRRAFVRYSPATSTYLRIGAHHTRHGATPRCPPVASPLPCRAHLWCTRSVPLCTPYFS